MEKVQSDAKAMKIESYKYTDNLLENVERVVTDAIHELEQCINVVRSNRNELR